jgi:hypothetical protein
VLLATTKEEDVVSLLMRAAGCGLYGEVEKLSVPTDARQYATGLALHAAAGGGHTRVVALLLDRCGRADDGDWGSALKAAAGGGHIDIVELLISRRTFGREWAGEALVCAAMAGRSEVARVLTEMLSVDSDVVDMTLVRASRGGHLEVVRVISEVLGLGENAVSLAETSLRMSEKAAEACAEMRNEYQDEM